MLILPLVALALISYACESALVKAPHSLVLVNTLHLSRDIFPGLFAVFVALLVPTNSRILQLLMVTISYLVLLSITKVYMINLFTYPSACVLALVLLPKQRTPINGFGDSAEQHNLVSFVKTLGLSFIVPLVVMGTVVTVAKQIDSFIDLIFTSSFVSSFFSFIFVPSYTVLQTLGFNTLLTVSDTLQYDNSHIQAIINSILLINLLSLPSMLLTCSCYKQGWIKVFMTILGFITLLTSHIGSCASIELSILLLFFPGAFCALLLSCCVIYFICLWLDVTALTNLFRLYQPDLTFKEINLLRLTTNDYLAISSSIVIPVLFVILLQMLQNRHKLLLAQRIRASTAGYRANARSKPDLCVVAILAAIGGLGNLIYVNRQGPEILLKVASPAAVSLQGLAQVCVTKPHYDRNSHLFICDLGANSYTVANRLQRMTTSNYIREEREIPLSQPFVIIRPKKNKPN